MNLNKKILYSLLFFVSLFFNFDSKIFSAPRTNKTNKKKVVKPKISPILEPKAEEIFFLKQNYFSQLKNKNIIKTKKIRAVGIPIFNEEVSAISIYQVFDRAEIKKIKLAEQKEKRTKSFKKPRHLSKNQWDTILESVSKASKKNELPEELILALIKKESSFRSKVISKSGAVGLTQLKPSTAKYECGLSYKQLTVIDLNIQCGVFYLSKLIDIFNGRLDLAITSYNAGPGAVKRAIRKANSKDLKKILAFLSKESQEFAQKIFMYSDMISKSRQ